MALENLLIQPGQSPIPTAEKQNGILDHLLRNRFIGVTDVTFVRAEGLSYGAEVKEKSVAKATQEIAQAV